MRHILHIGQIIFSLVACILYWGWLRDGYLDDCWNPQILFENLCIPSYPFVFIGAYGSFIGGLIWYIREFRNI